MAKKVPVKRKKKEGFLPGDKKRIAEILEVIFSYAQLHFDKKAGVKGDDSYIDAVAAGINMLGEELQSRTISLHEKEVLIREIHHRVKNNLAIIASLLNIQATKVKDEYHRQLLEDCRNKLMAISHIHQQLYFTNDFSKLDFGAYIADIISMIESTYSYEKAEIVTSIQPVIVNINKAVPCSLILNELVTNCYKHAFRGKKGKKRIFISLKNSGNTITLTVKDNGVGISGGRKSGESMGLSLVRDLAGQLDGKVKWSGREGTEVKLTFRN